LTRLRALTCRCCARTRLVNIGVDDVIEGRPNLMLGILWQLVRMQLLAGVDLVHVPELVVLLEPGEALADLLKLPAEKILLRWVNHHLAAAGAARRIGNFGEAIKDCDAYAALLAQLEPSCADAASAALALPLGEARATALLRAAEPLLTRASTRYVRAADITAGNAKLNLAFVASLFNARHGLVLRAEDVPAAELAELLEFNDSGEGREERVMGYWVNSLGLEAASDSLVADAADGSFLLQLIDRLSPGCVDWRRVAKPPFKLPFKRLENLNLALQLAKAPPFKLNLVGVDGKDLMDGNAKFALALFSQLLRYDQLTMLQGLSGCTGASRSEGSPGSGRGSPGGSGLLSDAEVVAMANAKVAAAGRASRMASFRDPSLADGIFFLDLLAAMGAGVNWELVSTEASDAAREANAKYVLSVARKAGCALFLLWDDITVPKPKMLFALTVSCLALQRK
jgi:plastin-1